MRTESQTENAVLIWPYTLPVYLRCRAPEAGGVSVRDSWRWLQIGLRTESVSSRLLLRHWCQAASGGDEGFVSYFSFFLMYWTNIEVSLFENTYFLFKLYILEYVFLHRNFLTYNFGTIEILIIYLVNSMTSSETCLFEVVHCQVCNAIRLLTRGWSISWIMYWAPVKNRIVATGACLKEDTIFIF